MSGLTLADALRLSPFQRAEPNVVAAHAAMTRALRWAHATEQRNVVPLLRPGDLVLTMGTNLPDDDDAQGFEEFARALAEAESAGLVVELGRRWHESLPDALVAACEAHDIPLITLAHETRFAELTQAIGEQIVDTQLAELLAAQRVHETFTELSFEQAGPDEILDAVSRMANGPVVLENAQHLPLDFLPGPTSPAGFLDNWQARSNRINFAGRTGWDERNGWLMTRLGKRSQDWGRLVIAAPEPPSQRLVAVAERAAAALALHRLHERNRDNLVRRSHQELVAALQSHPDSEETISRCELARFPTQRRRFTALIIRAWPPGRAGIVDEILSATVHAISGMRLAALACIAERDVVVLISAAPTTDADVLADRLAARLHARHQVRIAAGRVVDTRDGISQTMTEARQIANAVPVRRTRADSPETGVHRLKDVHIRGLLALLGADERLRLFVARELGALRQVDAEGPAQGDLIRALRALVEHPTSKTDAATSLHISRSAFYDRIARIEQILDADLDDAETRLSLHFALLADEVSSDEG